MPGFNLFHSEIEGKKVFEKAMYCIEIGMLCTFLEE